MKERRKHKIHKRITVGVLAAALFLTLPGVENLKVLAEPAGTQKMGLSEAAGKIHSLYTGVELEEAFETEYGTKNLIVSTSREDFDTLGAEERIFIGDGVYVLSYADPESAKAACEVYQEMEGINYAESDLVVKAQAEAGQDEKQDEEQAGREEPEEAGTGKNDSTVKEAEDKEDETSEKTVDAKEEPLDAEKEADTKEPGAGQDSGNDVENAVAAEETKSTESEVTEDVPEETAEDDIVRVALLDTGIKTDIGNLASYIQDTGNNASGSGDVGNTSDDNSHGTAMAQVIVTALEMNGKDSGSVKILPVKVLDNDGYGTILTTYLGMKAAMEQGVDIICLGLSGKGESKLIEGVVDEAYNAGITVIAAAGNDASNVSGYVPGSCEKAVVITSAKNQKKAAEDSNYGDTVDFSAYGTREVLNLAGKTQTVSGTSIACAYVTGVTASLERGMSDEKRMSCEEVEAELLKRAVPVTEESFVPYLGKGMIGEVPKKEEVDKKETESGQDSVGKDGVYKMESVSSLKAASSDAIYDPNAKKTGYHLEQDGKSVICMHGMDHSAYISCEGSGLNPDKSYLKGKVTSSSKKLTITSQTITKYDQNTMASLGAGYGLISPYVVKASVNGDSYAHTLAAPYTCPDGNAGYAYYRHYFSYCDETEQWYFVGSEHVWLGCSGGDVGLIEVHPRDFSHIITKYKFVANEYKIQFDGNGAASGSMKDLSMTYDKEKKLTANAYKKTGYTFTGWNTKKNGSGTSYSNKQIVKNLTDKEDGMVTLYAQWEPITYTVQYNGNGETSGSMAASTHIYDKEKKLTKNGFERKFSVIYNKNCTDKKASITKTNDTEAAVFDDWSKTKNSRKVYDDEEAVKNLTDKDKETITLYARWKDGAIILPSGTREGYELLGWSMNKNAVTADEGYTAGNKVTVSSNMNLYAVWRIKTYTIKYDANGGTGTMEDGMKTHFQAYTIKDNAFIHNGYDFVEWNTKADGTGTSYAEGEAYKEEESVTLYAIWKEHFNVAYIGNGQTQGTDFIDAGEDGYGHSEKLDYTFDDNKEKDEEEENPEDYFQKTETATYTDEETGETMNQEIEGTVVGWAIDEENAKSDYGLGEVVHGETLVNRSKTYGNFTIGSPGTGYNEFQENSIVANAMSSVRGSAATSATIPSLGGVGTVYNDTPYVNMYAVWDMGPVIEAYDRYYTLEEAQNGFIITEEELLNAAKATDEEVKSGSNEEGRLKNFLDEENQTSFTVMDYQAEEFTGLTGSAVISVTYRAEDAAGNVTKKMILVHIVDGHDTIIDGYDIGTEPDEGKVRFISEKYLDTLDEDSVWVKNEEYREALLDTLSYRRLNPEQSDPLPLWGDNYTVDIPGTGEWNKTPQSVWRFTREQVKEAQQFVEDYGPSNYEHEDGLQKFYEKFAECRQEP